MFRIPALITLLSWIVIGLTAQAPGGASNRKFAVIVGLSRYDDAGTTGLKYANWDANLFAQHLKTVRGGAVPEQNIRVLIDQAATTARIEQAFRWLSSNVGRRDQVYLFISGIGRSTVLSRDGYILTFDKPAEKDPISLKRLKEWIQNCCSTAEVFLFADLCREQPVFEDLPLVRRLPLDNKINYSVRGLADSNLASPFGGLLASREKEPSFEAAPGVLPTAPRETAAAHGNGIFTYYLVQSLQAPGGLLPAPPKEVAPFVQFLGDHVAEAARKLDKAAQRPTSVGKLGVIPVDWSQPGTSVKTSFARRPFPAFPGLLAFAGAAFDPDMLQGAEPALLDRFVTAVEDGRLQGPGSVAEIFPQLRSQNFAGGQMQVYAGAVEDAAAQVVARYGTGDQFPGDPRRIGKADFELTAALYAEARDLRVRELQSLGTLPPQAQVCAKELGQPLAMPNDPRVLSYEARRLFSISRAALSTATDDEQRAGNLSQGGLEQAERQLQCAQAIDSGLPEAANALGIVELLMARYDRDPARRMKMAAEHFRQTLAVTPNWAYPRHNLALVYTEQGRFSAAENEIRAAIERTPYYPYLYYNLGLALQRQNKQDAAARAYRDAIATFDIQIRRYRARGDTWTDLPARAAVAGRVADTLKRNQAEAFNALGALYALRKRFDDADRYYGLALAADPNLAPATHNRALLYLESGGADRRAAAETLLTANVAFQPSRMKLAEVLLQSGDVGKALQNYRAVLAAAPDNVAARLGTASALEAQKQFREALENLAWPGGQSDLRVQEKLGDLHLALGEQAEACTAFRSAQRLERQQFSPSLSNRKALSQKLKACD